MRAVLVAVGDMERVAPWAEEAEAASAPAGGGEAVVVCVWTTRAGVGMVLRKAIGMILQVEVKRFSSSSARGVTYAVGDD